MAIGPDTTTRSACGLLADARAPGVIYIPADERTLAHLTAAARRLEAGGRPAAGLSDVVAVLAAAYGPVLAARADAHDPAELPRLWALAYPVGEWTGTTQLARELATSPDPARVALAAWVAAHSAWRPDRPTPVGLGRALRRLAQGGVAEVGGRRVEVRRRESASGCLWGAVAVDAAGAGAGSAGG